MMDVEFIFTDSEWSAIRHRDFITSTLMHVDINAPAMLTKTLSKWDQFYHGDSKVIDSMSWEKMFRLSFSWHNQEVKIKVKSVYPDQMDAFIRESALKCHSEIQESKIAKFVDWVIKKIVKEEDFKDIVEQEKDIYIQDFKKKYHLIWDSVAMVELMKVMDAYLSSYPNRQARISFETMEKKVLQATLPIHEMIEGLSGDSRRALKL